MTIFESRLDECIATLSMLLELKDNNTIKIMGANYPIKQVVPDMLKTLRAVILADELKAESIFRYVSEAYPYITGMSDSIPEFEIEPRI